MTPTKKKEAGAKKTPGTKDPEPAATFSEKEASERLGISIEAVTMMRRAHLSNGIDFTREKQLIRFSPSGMDKLVSRLGERPQEGEPLQAGKVVTLIVDRSNFPNPRILMAVQPGSTTVVRVRVKDSKNWMRGMEIPNCRYVGAGLYHYEGRQPRFRGKM